MFIKYILYYKYYSTSVYIETNTIRVYADVCVCICVCAFQPYFLDFINKLDYQN